MPPKQTGETTTEDVSPQSEHTPAWRRVWDAGVGGPEPASPAPRQLTLLTLALLAVMLAAWRGAILVVSEAWARLGVREPWPDEIGQMALWRYSFRWDSGWYLTIARDGYYHVPDGQSSIAFFPLFPFSMRFLDQVLPGTDVLAGLVIVHLALVGALIYIYKLVQLDYPEIVAWRAIFFTLIFPGSFFFSALYTESLLLLGFAGTLYHARRGQWLLAGVFGCLTGLTKLIGIVLIAPVGLELLRQNALSLKNPRPALYSSLVPAGAIGYLAYLHVQYGDFRVYFDAQSHWFRNTFSPEPFVIFAQVITGNTPELFHYPANITPIHSLFTLKDMGALFLFLGAGIYLWLRVRPSYGALVIAGAMVPALSGTPMAMARHMAILFPVFILIGRIQSEPIRNAIAIVSVFGLGMTTFLFVNGFWAG